jgi:hypothetical protein
MGPDLTRVSRLVRASVACSLMLFATMARAAEPGFSESLSPQERIISGVSRLPAAERAKLDQLEQHDATLARQGGVTGFSSAFSQRHSAQERDAAGIDRLSAGELTALDALVARSIAEGPPPSEPFSYEPHVVAAPAPVLVSAPLKAEVHGDLSLTVGGGSHGSSFYGTSMDVFVTDPSGKFTLGVGFSEFRSKGFFIPVGPCGPLLDGPPYLDW